MEKCCDICGDIGVPEALIVCSQCQRNVEHMYCMRTPLENYVDDWHCEECEKAKQLSSCQLGDLTSVSKTNSLDACKGGELRAERKKLPNESRVGSGDWEKMAPTGKTKYISVKEALMLSSGVNKYLPSSSNTRHSKPSRRTSGLNRAAAFKPRPSLLNFSDQNLASETLQPRKPQRPGNVEIRVNQQQQSRKQKLTDELRPASRPEPSEAPKVPHKGTEQPSRVELPVQPSPFAISGGDDHDTTIHSEKCSQVPAFDALWKGSFAIEDAHAEAKANHLVEAHPPLRVHRKIYEFSKKMPQVLHLELVPSATFWSAFFHDHIPDERDIALYFFPGIGARLEDDYVELVESISSTNFALREQIADVELLVFSSKLLPLNRQCLNGKHFLWGLFRRLKRDAIVKLDRTLELSDDANREDVDMDIDMIGGVHVGRMDVRVTRQEPTAAAVALLPESAPSPRGHLAPAAAVPSPTVKREFGDLIPPGFEEVYRLRLQSSSSSVDHVRSRQ